MLSNDSKASWARFTAVPNGIIDWLLPDLTGAELKLLLYVCRRTRGFGKVEDRISVSQMQCGIRKKNGDALDRGTGLSRQAIVHGLRRLEAKSVIHRVRGKGRSASRFGLTHQEAIEQAKRNAHGTPDDQSASGQLNNTDTGLQTRTTKNSVQENDDIDYLQRYSEADGDRLTTALKGYVAREPNFWQDHGNSLFPPSELVVAALRALHGYPVADAQNHLQWRLLHGYTIGRRKGPHSWQWFVAVFAQHFGDRRRAEGSANLK